MQNHGLCLLFTALTALQSLESLAGVFQKWTVETTEMSEQAITGYHGETLLLQVQMSNYGRIITDLGKAEFLWQTNGMDNVWWTTNAVCSSGLIRFNWTPELDCGADSYKFFFRVTDKKGANYRANGTIELSGSPSGDVSYLPLPQKIIDFNEVTVQNATNAPWVIKGEETVTSEMVTNIAEYVISTNGFLKSYTETDPIWTANSNSFANSLKQYADSKIVSTDPAFSNAVLSVGLGIDTNSVAVLNEIASGFGGFPLSAGETAITVGGLLMALAAAIAWLKKNKAAKATAKTSGVAMTEHVATLDSDGNPMDSGIRMEVVTAVPATPVANTIYFVTGS